jgi:hypothetical protein
VLFSASCEGVFDAHPDVRRSGLAGVRLGDERIPVICVEPEADADLELLRAELLDIARAYPATAAIETILFHPSLPVDTRHNSKIVREKLAVWAAKHLQQAGT